MEDDTPIWRYWLNLAEVPVESAVWLSLNLEPGTLGRELDESHVRADRAERLEMLQAHFILRRDAARTHIRVHNLAARYDEQKERHLVSLPDFRLWGERLPVPFTFPDEFPRPPPVVEPPAPEATSKVESSARNENANLRIIAAMLALLRDKDGGRFPSEAKVIELLVQRFGAADGVSKRNLEAVFSAAKRAAGDDLQPMAEHRK